MSTCLVFVFGALIEYAVANVLARKASLARIKYRNRADHTTRVIRSSFANDRPSWRRVTVPGNADEEATKVDGEEKAENEPEMMARPKREAVLSVSRRWRLPRSRTLLYPTKKDAWVGENCDDKFREEDDINEEVGEGYTEPCGEEEEDASCSCVDADCEIRRGRKADAVDEQTMSCAGGGCCFSKR
ncbi:unnamed protein product, partial [Protopolystoma xenopodis]